MKSETTSPFGTAGVSVPRLGLGCMGMSGVHGASSDVESIRPIELGCGFLDTADVHGAGHNEELVGKALSGHRESFFHAGRLVKS